MQTDRVAYFEDQIRQRGFALTSQRRIILQELLSRKDHPTADQILDSIRDQAPGMSRTTVYRVLDTLVEIGAARKVFHAEAKVRFDPNTSRHHHLVCEQCGRLEDMDEEFLHDMKTPSDASGFKIKDFSINFIGLCTPCQTQPTS